MNKPKNIYQRMHSIMSDAEYLQKGKAQQGQGVLYDDVAAMLKPLFVKHGVALQIQQKSLNKIGDVGTNQKIYEGKYTVHFINVSQSRSVRVVKTVSLERLW